MTKRRKGKQSRSQLQNRLQSLKSEMLTLTERVRIAQEDFREKFSPEESSISDGRRAYDFEHQSSASSSYIPNYPVSRRNLNYSHTGLSQSTNSISSMAVHLAARGNWKKEDGGVLIFSAADAPLRPKQLSQSRTSSKRSISEQSCDNEDEEYGGDMRSNDGLGKRYSCLFDGCEKSFTTSGHARRHGRCHSNRKVFICPHQGCNSAFTRRDNCRQHQRVRHHLCLPVLDPMEEAAAEEYIQTEK
jgi:hypothetical protein